ncbi:MAG: glycosyltransferase family 1 protein [Caldilineales bacterium]|nr:glycosyltransferase family 1 protein [Caldilineales bacterium]
MKITIFAAGSRGDIQPCVALGKGLQMAGYDVRLAAPENFAGFVQEHKLSFYPLRGDVQAIMAGDTGRQFMETGGGNPLKSIRVIQEMIAPIVREMSEDVYESCRDADALICLGVFNAFGATVAEALRIPIMNVVPTPWLPSRAFAAPSWPIQKNLGGLHNYLSGIAMFQVVWLWYRPFVNKFRQRLGLANFSAARYYRTLRATPMLCAYSPAILPRPADWPDDTHVCGYFFLDDESGWRPSSELQAFLDAGDPPIYVGFGSMSGRNPEQLTEIVLEALARCGQRGVLLTGWGGLRADLGSEKIFVLDAAPHSWLFPRMAAVVHHGGAGTTAEGLRAGVPNVIVPFIFDQPFWGERIRALGLGPEPLPRKKLIADRLAAAIDQAMSDAGMRQRARACGEAIRAEDGVGNAVDVVRRYLGEPMSDKG